MSRERFCRKFVQSIPDILPSQDSGALHSYISPKSASRIIKKINDATGLGLDESKINRQKQICIEKLGSQSFEFSIF